MPGAGNGTGAGEIDSAQGPVAKAPTEMKAEKG